MKDFKADEMNEVKIAEDSLYRKLQLKKNLFVDILENNNKKELLLLDNEISPAKLGIRSEFTESLLDKLIKNYSSFDTWQDLLEQASSEYLISKFEL